MAPSFNSIPPEIRHRIYEYLLFDLNLVTVHEREEDWLELRPVYATSLFTVNKIISGESLQYSIYKTR
jgi:hypothetical protein